MELQLQERSSGRWKWLTQTHFVFHLAVALLCCSALLFFSSSQSVFAQTSSPLYSCGNGNSNHCYGAARWQGNIDGSYTQIFTNQMHAGSIFVNNEMWLGNGTYWVEVGTKAEAGWYSGSEVLFWADSRPGKGLMNNYGTPLGSSAFGKYGSFQILRDAPGSCLWNVSAFVDKYGISGQSIDNCFSSSVMDIGMELAGSSGASAPRNGFISNQWYSYSNGNSWHYQARTADMYLIPVGPISRSWVTVPASGNKGGQWSTCLLSNC